MALYQSVADTIGGTPLVHIQNFEKAYGLAANIYAKLEYFNPAGSVKDRIAKAIIDDAAATGKLKADSVIIEPTSGNTGIGIAAYAAANGFDGFTTSLTVSPHKPSAKVFAAADGDPRFLREDFKKHEGFKISVRRAAELGLYRQAYCGCEFSRRERKVDA